MEIKHVEDYYDKIQERFPDLERKEMEKILKHGLRSFYMTNLYGADVLFKNPKYTMYVGEMFKDVKKFFKYWHYKHSIKLRIKYKRKKPQYNGYYYFGVSEDDYKKYNLSKKGRKTVVFEEIHIFKIMEESFLDGNKKYFFKLSIPEEGDFHICLKDYKTSQFALIAKRDSDGKVKLI